jgi:hypothetical protein
VLLLIFHHIRTDFYGDLNPYLEIWPTISTKWSEVEGHTASAGTPGQLSSNELAESANFPHGIALFCASNAFH